MLKQYLDTEYDIDEEGKCYSHKSNKFLTPQLSLKYPAYNLTINGTKKKVKIHRMVAETFLPKVEGKEIVNHIDGDTHNYKLNNLEWVDSSENAVHANETGLRPKSNQNAIFYTDFLENEEWKQIKDFDNYLVSSYGRVMNKNTKRLLKPAVSNSGGYLEVSLWKNNKGTTTRIHRLVYSTFNNDYELDGYVINHIDGNKVNNNIKNLEKVTYQENNLHAEYVIKTHKQAKKIGKFNKDGVLLDEYPSISQATRETGINNIGRAARCNRTAGGYYWKFL